MIVSIGYVYMSNILLLNYLIAIMSTTYSVMQDSGSFMYKVNLYNYCERYLVAFGNDAYGELALHAAPISILTTPMMIVVFMFKRQWMVVFSKYYSYFMHWLENCIFLVFFIIIETLLVFPVYLKNIFQIGWASMGLFTTVYYVARWVFTGLFITMYIGLKDVLNLINILRMHEGCRKF